MTEKNDKFQKMFRKKFPDFVIATDSLCAADLNKKLLTYSKYREETELAKKNDQKLNNAKEEVSELGAPYRETLNALKMKLAYLHLLIKDNGDLVDDMGEFFSDDQKKD